MKRKTENGKYEGQKRRDSLLFFHVSRFTFHVLRKTGIALALLGPEWALAGEAAEHGAAEGGASPEKWVAIFTVISFLVVMAVLAKFGWPQILQALHDREETIRRSLAAAEDARRAAQAQAEEFTKQKTQIESQAKELISQAERQAAELREKLMKEAEAGAKDLMAKTRKQLEEDRGQVVKQIRSELAGLVTASCEKLLKRAVDKNVQAEVVKEFISELEDGHGSRN